MAYAWGRAGGTLLVQREQSSLRDSKLRPLPLRQDATQKKEANFLDGARPAGLPPLAPPASGPTIVLCSETHEFRSAARAMVRGGDSVLEIGCSFGDTTVELVARAAAVTAIDCSKECLDRTATRVASALVKRAKTAAKTGEAAPYHTTSHGNGCNRPAGAGQDGDGTGADTAAIAMAVPAAPCRVRVELIDAVRYPGQLFGLADAERAEVVFADIGGNRASSALAPLLLAFGALRSPPVLTVVKCRELCSAAAEHAAAHGGVGFNGEVPDAASLWSALKEQYGQADPGPAVAMASPPAPATATHTDSTDSDSTEQPPAPPHSTATPPSPPSVAADGRQLNPNCAAGEKRICFKHLNTGRCVQAGCGYRHLARDHPDALADHAKRSEVGWQPEDPRRRPGATVPKA